jgi:hypothetical protein
MDSSTPAWYGHFTMAEETTGLWQVGPYTLWARRLRNLWLLAGRCGDETCDGVTVELPCQLDEPPEGARLRRYAFHETPGALILTPSAADRPVIVALDPPLFMPPDEQVELVLSTPLWLEVKTGEPPLLLLEQAMERPSDTWFGPSTMKGELCYAFPTSPDLDLHGAAACPPHHARSVVTIRNLAADVLEMKMIKVPTGQLSLFAAADGRLWTESLRIEHEEETTITLKIDKGPPAPAGEAVRVRGPRIAGSRLRAALQDDVEARIRKVRQIWTTTC